jgi:hypothetical protein
MFERNYSDQEIADGIKAKNAFFFNYFYDHYSAAFYGEIMATLLKEEVACETLKIVFRRIWSDIRQFEFKEPLFIWALKIVRHETSRKKIELVLSDLFYCQKLPPQKTSNKISLSA